ncbi:vWA domain-containing protein [Aureliella helgolandensis]|uniref:von Willebrand factor type A domain protein n=1 Tax=Aureliella helgolandensis TaxID=2527968 RepID=A0A518G079_9BACT|nr:vWA domain-containing protein [Aureliella helgolandensis]QDV22005.1 von Willebrand factor type A domain protein [Aureliella helgolandensis]
MSFLHLAGNWGWSLGLAIALSLLAVLLYYREFLSAGGGYLRWFLPLLRCVTIFLLCMTLSEPTWEHWTFEGKPGRITFLLDGSRSMSLTDEPAIAPQAITVPLPSESAFKIETADPSPPTERPQLAGSKRFPPEPPNRFERANTLLYGSEGLLSQLRDQFELQLLQIDDDTNLPLWQSSPISPTPVSTTTVPYPTSPDSASPSTGENPLGWASHSPLGTALTQVPSLPSAADPTSSGENTSQSQAHEIVVLLSDGRSNHGRDPLEATRILQQRNIAVYTIGFGSLEQPLDLALRGIEHPQKLYGADTLRGQMWIDEQLPLSSKYVARIEHGSEVVWQQELQSLGQGRREVNFSFPLEAIYDRSLAALPAGTLATNLPIQMHASLNTSASEASLTNNRRDFNFSISVTASQILLVDGRSRWETRYLKNLFSRDPAWELHSLLAGSSTFFTRREQLFEFNLILWGDVPASFLSREQMQWLTEFVHQGGGLIFIDGARQHLQDAAYAPIQELLPVKWLDSANQGIVSTALALEKRVKISDNHRDLDALQLELATASTSDEQEAASPTPRVSLSPSRNQELWQALPPIYFVSRVAALAGSEVLVDAVSPLEHSPLLISRQYGGGRVLFLATDETWRWRYNVGDLYHQRFWNQLAQWAQKRPLSIQGEFVSLDTGPAQRTVGSAIEIRAELRLPDQSPTSQRAVAAIVEDASGAQFQLPLSEQTDMPGNYSGTIATLPAGSYRVRLQAENFPLQSLNVRSEFSVVSEDSPELLDLTCDQTLLQSMAKIGAGQYFHELQAGQLIEQLSPLQSGQRTITSTALWDSYWWFGSAMVLLTAEWWLRKGRGLI